MTGFRFDTAAVVELQDEARFLDVTRGQTGVSFVPPRDMAPGERLRLTAELRTGKVQQTVTFALVAHPTQATHQVDVYRDRRDWQTLHDETNQAWLTNKNLHDQNKSLQSELDEARANRELFLGLRGAYLNGFLLRSGIQCGGARTWLLDSSTGEFHVQWLNSCRAPEGVAVEMLLENLGSDPWTMTDAYLVNAQGESKKSVRVWQEAAIAPGLTGKVFAEFAAKRHEMQGFNTLTLQGTGTAVATLSQVTFP